MPKVAIATMTGGANYGNALQNYAVLKLIEHCGYEAETLNITTENGYPDAIPDSKNAISKLNPAYVRLWLHGKANSICGAKNDEDFNTLNLKKAKENAVLWREAVRLKQERFSAFQKEILHYTDFEVSNVDFNLPALERYSAFVAGSDQIWNPYYRTNSMVEFLQMAPKEKRIAFAPSFGVSVIPECRRKEYSVWLSEIPYLSVRESAGAEIIRNLTGRDAEILLDPTFGLTKEEWLSFAQRPASFNLEPGKYVFCYFLGNRTKAYTRYIRQYADRHNCAVVDVWDIAQLENYSYSPQEFVWLLANARAVFTDSFHGCAFSVNLQKPFAVFDRAGDGCITQSSRITTVLGRTGLEKRKYEQLPVDEVDRIDFTEAGRAISAEREKLIDYLSDSIKAASSSACSIRLAPKRHCTGCGACVNVCARNAVRMLPDEEGFLYPSIDPSVCVGCHACEKVCPADKAERRAEETKAFFAFSNDSDICRNSSSGGVFTELAEAVIKDNGIVYGAGFDDDFRVCHISAEKKDELTNLRTSKYVQSDTGDVYRQVRRQLDTGRRVMFSGTPCQCAALKAYLGREYKNLLLVDIICHGVPSPKIWKKYLEQEHGDKKIEAVSFRNKDLGWNDFSMKIEYVDGSFYRELAVKDPYERAFLTNLSLRPSCYQCQYKTVSRVSDITIADYWGAETVHPELKEQQGVSLVLTHSEKGEKAIKLLDGIALGKTDLQRAVKMNHACTHSVPWPAKRNDFFKLQDENGISSAAEECLRLSVSQKVRKTVVRNGVRVKKVLRKMGIVR